MKLSIQAALAALLLATATAAPALAQAAPGEGRGHMGHRGMREMFVALSPEGRTIMWTAMRQAKRDDARGAIEGARGRTLDLLGAEQLNVDALRRAMAEERGLAQRQQERMQDAMLDGYQRLSLADRKAFVAEARAMRARFEARRAMWRERKDARAAGEAR